MVKDMHVLNRVYPKSVRMGWSHQQRSVKVHLLNPLDNLQLMEKKKEDVHPVRSVLRYLKKFTDVTSLHGFSHLCESNKPLYERLFWLAALVVVYSLAFIFVAEQIQSYEKSPVLVSIDTKQTYVNEIPFPSFTFCPFNTHRVQVSSSPNDSITDQMQDLSNYICNTKSDRRTFDFISEEAAHRTFQKALNIEECEELMVTLRWRSFDYNPCRLLQPVVSAKGFCITFNQLPLENILRKSSLHFNRSELGYGPLGRTTWSLHRGFTSNDTMPLRVGGSSQENGVDILIKSPEVNRSCYWEKSDIIMIVHGPHELVSQNYLMVPIARNKHTFAQITPRVGYTSDSLESWSPDQRGCYFETERRLMHFIIYSQNNCDLECEANKTLSECGCSPFYHPRQKGTPVCGTRKKRCVQLSLLGGGDGKSRAQCNCKPSCIELKYEVQTSSYTRNWKLHYNQSSGSTPSHMKKHLTDPNAEFAGINIFFLSKFTVPVRRNSLLSGIHFIGNIGGLMGLFLGCSFLSIVEIVYFLFLRPWHRLCPTFGKSKLASTS